jgi:hypothetical protein
MASRIDKVGDLWSNMRRGKRSVQRARDNLSGGVG